MLYNLLKYLSSARVSARPLVYQYITQQSNYSTHIVRRFLLMPDLGQCGEVGDEKRSDSLDDFPRVVGAS